MNDEWITVPIGEVCKGIYDGPHATPNKTDSGPIFLGISNLQNGRIDLSDVEYLSEEDFAKWTRRVTPQPNDIVFSYETRLGEAALVPEGIKFCLGRRMALMRPDISKVYPRFLLYAYLGPEFQQTVAAKTVRGSTVDRIPLIEFPSFPITLPPLPEQRTIAEVLGALDDKIELNRRMNATLEAMAAALFKAWFVDSEEAEGWETGIVGDDFNLTMGQSPPGETYNEDGVGIPFFQGKTDFGFRFPTNRVYCTAPTRFAEEGDTLVSVRAPVGDVNMVTEKCAIGRGVASIRHYSGSRSYTYYTMRFLHEDFLRFEAEGTVFGSINKNDFKSLKVALPPAQIIQRFEDVCYSLDQKIESNVKESQTLATMRDTLLPRLMRGEVRVKNGEMEL
jgi:type I restriction enzyme, S subunit